MVPLPVYIFDLGVDFNFFCAPPSLLFQPGIRRPAPGNRQAPPTKPRNPNQRLPKQLPGAARGPGRPAPPLNTTRGGGIQKKVGGNRAPMHIDPVIAGNTNALRRSRPNPANKITNYNVQQPRRGPNPQQQQQGRRQPHQQHQHHHQQQHPRNPNSSAKKKQPRKQPQQQNQQQQRHHRNDDAPPGFGGPSHNPYQDALYAKSQKPLFARFEELQTVPMDRMAVETITEQPAFIAGPVNKHGVRLPV
jgi:hypothetical protein